MYPHARFLLSVDRLEQLPADQGAEVAVAGRSNAGKSSAINALTQRRALARSSKTPGRTQLINVFELEPDRRLVDLPGYGYARAPIQVQLHWQERLIRYLQTRRSLRALLLLIDARRGVGEEDAALIEWAGSRELPVQVLLSKCDKLNRREAGAALRKAQATVGSGVGVLLFSAVSRQGLQEARTILQSYLEKNTPVGAVEPHHRGRPTRHGDDRPG